MCWTLSQFSFGRRRGLPWTYGQFLVFHQIAVHFFVNVGRNRSITQARENMRTPHRKEGRSLESKSGPVYCEADMLTSWLARRPEPFVSFIISKSSHLVTSAVTEHIKFVSHGTIGIPQNQMWRDPLPGCTVILLSVKRPRWFYPVKRSPREGPQRTRHHFAWCTPGRRWSPAPSTSKGALPMGGGKNHRDCGVYVSVVSKINRF